MPGTHTPAPATDRPSPLPARSLPHPSRTRPGNLEFSPFRGVRYAPGHIGSLESAVASSPSPLASGRTAGPRDLPAHSPRRLLLPDRPSGEPSPAHHGASERLRDWLRTDVLRLDPTPVMYAYEQHGPDGPQRGLIAALRLPTRPGRVLPHRSADPSVAADRMKRMRMLGAQPEPVLLTHRGGDLVARLLDTVTAGEPLCRARTADGARHSLWAVADPGDWDRVNADLSDRRLLIADGHHRYLAYHYLRDRQIAGATHGPVLLVDETRYPLEPRPLHRVLPGIRLDEFLASLPDPCALRPVAGPPGSGAAALATALDALAAVGADRPACLVGDGLRYLLATDFEPPGPCPAVEAAAARPGAPGTEPRLHHDPAGAAADAERSRGTVLIPRAPSYRKVRASAENTLLLPNGSLSFAPKPPLGLVLRLLHGV
ncbi:DUF1015 family protein [Streptomyces sp. DH37]|uniref:DUF1015 family protein n=1 Tax=Streptomyces sp. DH37 TaxID=3040122 RepID=UPI0024431430|nr:DUF1015 family protein [Streptomyces sp. DH37]MDG9704170.1 DUF1015 family protein [Streptomyces sp. DH37]